MVQGKTHQTAIPADFYDKAREAAIEIYKQLQGPGQQIDPVAIAALSRTLFYDQQFSDDTLTALGSMSYGNRHLLLWQTAVGIEVGELRAHC